MRPIGATGVRRPGPTSTNSDHATSTTAAVIMPARGLAGSAMPTKPPITHASCRVVSLRAKALVRTRSGTSRWIVESSESLARHCASPATKPSRQRVNSP